MKQYERKLGSLSNDCFTYLTLCAILSLEFFQQSSWIWQQQYPYEPCRKLVSRSRSTRNRFLAHDKREPWGRDWQSPFQGFALTTCFIITSRRSKQESGRSFGNHCFTTWAPATVKLNSPFYSYSWKRGWSWPCFDTIPAPLRCKSCCSYAN